MRTTFDFRLVGVLAELSTLQEYLNLVEESIERGQQEAADKFDAVLKECPDTESEYGVAFEDYRCRVEITIPHILRGPFLVALFAVYEAAVTEIAPLVQKKQKQPIALDDIKGDLLDRAKKYYKHVLNFELSKSNRHWQRLVLLSELRNAIAHTNGRIDMIRSGTKKKILKNEGVTEKLGYLIVTEAFLRETFELVDEDLRDLVARYKKWDTENPAL